MRRRLQALWWTLSLRAEADIKELIKEMNAEKMKPDVEFNDGYSRTDMQKDAIIQKLKENGGRITKQRLILLDIILGEDCSCCKEIYYKAAKIDNRIGVATVYRMINTLEEIGAINRRNMYKIAF